MDWIASHWLQLLFLGVYAAVLAQHGWAASRRSHSLGDFLVGGRSIGGWLVALSFYATFVSTNSFVGHAGKSWDVGLLWYVKGAVVIACAYVAWYGLAPRFVERARAWRSLTIPDFLGHLFDSRALRRAAAGVVIGASVVFMVAVYKGSALALAELLDLAYPVAVVAIFVVVTGYTLAGGFQSVVATDAFQGVLMLAGAVALPVALFVRGGGPAQVLGRLSTQHPELTSVEGPVPLVALLGLSLAGGLKLLVDPKQLSRWYGLRDRRALVTARRLAPLLILVTYVCLLPVGALARAVVPAGAVAESDQVVPYLLGTLELLGPVLSCLFLVVLMAAAMSSLDSLLLVAASSASRDLVIRADDDVRAVSRTRQWVIALSSIAMLLAQEPFGDIVSITALSGSLYAACFLPSLVLGLWWRPRARAAIGSLLVGAVSVIATHIAQRAGWMVWHEVYVGLALSTLTYLGLTPPLSARGSLLDIAARGTMTATFD